MTDAPRRAFLSDPWKQDENPYETVEGMKAELPQDRSGYILARFAAAQYHTPDYQEAATNALRELDKTNDDGVLEPPLSDALASQIGEFVRGLDAHIRTASGPASLLILATAIDHGSRSTNG